ncbi:hypothetical protein L3Q82_021548 [Scortum barcoo]|uniref:Uncharacterized protein n=1 Tax=Scortum barcoo TaxID=214431 RepID=A0ACB8X4L6_9TELE|nr:hypothetical protein L3Q82_021548 [Scortum barcoo]
MAGKGPRRPNPWTKTLAIGTWNVTSLGGKEPELVQEVERYQLEIVGLTSTHSLGSGTQLLERGWTLHYSGVAQGEHGGELPYVLDTQVKGGAELSTVHHLVVSWIRWWRRKLDRPGRPKHIVRVCWERLAEPSVREVFNSHLRQNFSQIPEKEAGDIESEWTMFSASIVDALQFEAVVSGACSGRATLEPWWWIPEERDAIKLKKESYRAMLIPNVVDGYWQVDSSIT